MKYTITINQHAIFVNGLVNKTDAIDWIIVDYLKDFALYKKARKMVYQNQEYIWLNYAHLINSLPVTKINGKSPISRRISKLKKLGLIKTYKDEDNTLYYTFTDKLIDICFSRQSDIDRLRKSSSTCHSRENGNPENYVRPGFRVKHGMTTDNDGRPVTPKATDPVVLKATDPIAPKATAQYKTKNTILNKDNNNDISFNSFSLKPKTEKNGFVSLSSNVWKTIDAIRQRQNANNKFKITRSKQAPITKKLISKPF